jgi:hypothetical protein
MGKKIYQSLKEGYCDIVPRFINFQLPENPMYSLRETLQLLASAGIRNSYVTTIARDLKSAGIIVKLGKQR